MTLQYLFTYESGSYCQTGQFNLAISFFFSKKKMDQHTILGRIGEGAHGIVLKAKHIEVFIENHFLLICVKFETYVIVKNGLLSLMVSQKTQKYPKCMNFNLLVSTQCLVLIIMVDYLSF